jgi:hypothetical protein
MVRAWLIFSSLILGVLFKIFTENGPLYDFFLFSDKKITSQLWIYFTMEHIIALQIASCVLIHDNTPRFFFWLFFFILILDLLHYILFFRDEGPGWNVIKACIFGAPLAYVEIKNLWTRWTS